MATPGQDPIGTPHVLFFEVCAAEASAQTGVMYGHLDKHPDRDACRERL